MSHQEPSFHQGRLQNKKSWVTCKLMCVIVQLTRLRNCAYYYHLCYNYADMHFPEPCVVTLQETAQHMCWVSLS